MTPPSWCRSARALQQGGRAGVVAGGVGAGAGGDHARRYLQSLQTDLSDLTRLFDNWPLSSRGDFVSGFPLSPPVSVTWLASFLWRCCRAGSSVIAPRRVPSSASMYASSRSLDSQR